MVKGATRGESHLLENGLNVYIFYNDDRPIDYWFSSIPVYEESNFINRDGKNKQILKYTGATCIEYKFNSFFQFHDKSTNDLHLINVLCNQDGCLKEQITNNSTMGGGRCLMIDENGLFFNHPFNTKNFDDMKKYNDDADLIGYITNIQQRKNDINASVSDFKIIMEKVNQFFVSKSNRDEKINRLLNLLKMNEELDKNFDSFNNKVM